MFSGFLSESIVARAVKKGLCEVNIVDLREFGLGRWKKTDDAPYGGGPGMLMRCEPWFAAVEKCLASSDSCLASRDSRLASYDSCLASRVSCPVCENPGEDMRHETRDAQKGQETRDTNRETRDTNRVRVIMTSPAGKTFTQRDAELFASLATSPSPSTSTPPPTPTPTLPSNSTSLSNSNSPSLSHSNLAPTSAVLGRDTRSSAAFLTSSIRSPPAN